MHKCGLPISKAYNCQNCFRGLIDSRYMYSLINAGIQLCKNSARSRTRSTCHALLQRSPTSPNSTDWGRTEACAWTVNYMDSPASVHTGLWRLSGSTLHIGLHTGVYAGRRDGIHNVMLNAFSRHTNNKFVGRIVPFSASNA